MKFASLLLMLCFVSMVGVARADDLDSLRKKVDQLESQLNDLRSRIDKLGPTDGHREVRVAEPVFIGTQKKMPTPLTMDDASINCPPRSFVTAIQILKTGNTVTQVRYACRGVE